MKKVLVGLVLSFAFLLIAALFVIPQKIKVTSTATYVASSQGVFNFLAHQENWKKWWPGQAIANKNDTMSLTVAGYDFNISKILYHAYEINFKKNSNNYSALLKIISFKVDSTGLELSTEINAGVNPINRINKYFRARNIKKVFDNIVDSLAQYTQKVKNIYGFDIKNEKVQMQYLLSANMQLTHYPSTEEVYSLIGKIRSYLKTTDAKEEFSPMLNIETKDSFHYFVRIGMPVNKKLPGTDSISVKQMLKNGNILVTEVTGGKNTIEYALKQIEKYISDYQRSIVAIPFQSLKTDRLTVTDSTKWITKIYYPVI
jgi:hypothetical protein